MSPIQRSEEKSELEYRLSKLEKDKGHQSEEFSSHENLVEFRLTRLEEAVTALSAIKETVLRWDAKFSSTNGLLQCPIHQERMDAMEKRVDKLESIVTDLDKFKWKAVGVLSVIMILVQVFGTTVAERFLKKNDEKSQQPIKIELVLPNGSITNATAIPSQQ